jgi:hypothetical protein
VFGFLVRWRGDDGDVSVVSWHTVAVLDGGGFARSMQLNVYIMMRCDAMLYVGGA